MPKNFNDKDCGDNGSGPHIGAAIAAGIAAGAVVGAIIAGMTRLDAERTNDQARQLLDRIVRTAEHYRQGRGRS